MMELRMKTYLQLDGRIYKQIRGTPMESPPSGLLVDATMKQFETKAIRPSLWIRYFNDRFIVLDKAQMDRYHHT